MSRFCLKVKKNSAFFYENENMLEHCSFKTGEKARYYCEPKNKKCFSEIIKLCQEYKVKYYILGNGTNTIFYKFDGLIICLKQLRSIEILGDDVLCCDAGVSLIRLNLFACECQFGGLEWSYGIPGSVGGAVIMNAGAYGHDMSEVIEKVEVFDGKRFKTLKKDKFWFKYRQSSFKKSSCIISKVYIKLKKTDSEEIKEKMMTNFEKRKISQPLNYPSAGSVFKRKENIIPAKIIDELGLKGTNVNGAEISTKHAGFIVNKGGAKVEDIEKLIKFIKVKVKEKKDINLEQEIIIVKK